MLDEIRDKHDESDYRADFDDEHHRIFDHQSRIEFPDGIANGVAQNFAVAEGSSFCLGIRGHGVLKMPFPRSSASAQESVQGSVTGRKSVRRQSRSRKSEE